MTRPCYGYVSGVNLDQHRKDTDCVRYFVPSLNSSPFYSHKITVYSIFVSYMIEILLLIVILKTNLFHVKFGSLKVGGWKPGVLVVSTAQTDGNARVR